VRQIVVLPTYNERENIAPLLRALRAASDAEVLVVDDGSPDGTADLARSLDVELGGVRVLERETKDGLGSAYRAGFAQVLAEGYDIVVTMDADLSHDPAVIPEMVRLLDDGADASPGEARPTGRSDGSSSRSGATATPVASSDCRPATAPRASGRIGRPRSQRSNPAPPVPRATRS